MTKIILKITGMHCTSCAMNIDGELEDIGVKDVKTNYAKGETEVEFDETKMNVKNIEDAIGNLGYTASIKEKS